MEQNTINGHVLILDDDQNIQSALSAALTAHGYRVSSFQRAKDALDALQTSNSESAPIDIIVTDVRIPEMDGLTFITNAKKIRPEIPIVVMTGFDCLETAIQAIRLGAFDFLKKPFTMIELLHSVDRALNHHQIVNENKVLSAAISNKWKFDQIVGKSQKMQNVFDLIKRVANTAATVLITGESGTGKEMIARAIHENGSQAGKPFVAVSVARVASIPLVLPTRKSDRAREGSADSTRAGDAPFAFAAEA